MNIKELVSEIVRIYEEMATLKTENESLKRDNNSLKSAVAFEGKLETAGGDANEALKLKFFNNYLSADSNRVKTWVFSSYSLPSVRETNDNGDDYTISFARWLSNIDSDDIRNDVLRFMSVQEVICLFRKNLEDVYNEKVAQFKKDNSDD